MIQVEFDETEKTMTFPVMEHFYTVQGEGFNSGKAAYFIRLAGCDVGCVWCDVKESWDIEGHPRLSIANLINEVDSYNAKNIVITGGEPLMHNLSELCESFRKRGCKMWIETSGTHPLSGSWDWICFSPKKFKKPLDEIYQVAHELKVIVYNQHDLVWAQSHAQKVHSKCQLFLQPEWGKSPEILPLIVDFVKDHPEWRISLQTHKFMQIP